MVKLIGAVLILFSGTMIGFFQASQFAARPKQIRMLILALQRLETEILFAFTPLPEALAHLARQTTEPLSSMFGEIAAGLEEGLGVSTVECWQRAVRNGWKRTSMKAAEMDVFYQLGHTLGITDREDQIKHLRLAVNQLQSEEEAARDDQKRYEKMWKSLGLLTGALVVIMMY